MAMAGSDMWQLTKALFSNSSGYARLFCVFLMIGYLLSFSERYIYMLTVLPGNVLPPNCWIWTCASHSVIEVHWWILVWDIVAVFVQSKLLGSLWGKVETVKFYVLVTLLVAMLTTLTYIGLYFLTQNTDYLFDNYVNGLAGYLAGIAVSVKQIMPEHVIVSIAGQKLRNNHLPLLLLILAVCLSLIGIVEAPYPLMFSWGLLVSWVYLRFYQKHSNGSRGDNAEHFSFASFFPVCCRALIVPLAECTFAVLVRMKLCQTSERKTDANRSTSMTVTLPGCKTHQGEDDRLQSVTVSKPGQIPSKSGEGQPKQTIQIVKELS